ncbi:hypothetical protein CLV92_11322 [Kineococcus xinjiangensis]|uniref:Helix-hairpin-helix protein n=1 Tax=Kineococcus xinjiangensis TaxID=512762 RepID=A0A2S6IEH6_9ACTN|nr:hypothetical protein [Kineococcus xinjiangensis]PPK92593.1 hypothetical protein CLV92_11322 [Kineococcus xinjiangensis]
MPDPSVPDTSTSDTSALPARIGRPALRALAAAGVTSLPGLARLREADLLQMHGVGPRALSLLREALAREGLALRPDR